MADVIRRWAKLPEMVHNDTVSFGLPLKPCQLGNQATTQVTPTSTPARNL